MNKIIKFANKTESREKIIKTCKDVNTLVIAIFLAMSGLCAMHIIPEWCMYPYIITGGIVLIVMTILFLIEDLQLDKESEDTKIDL